MDPKLVVSQVGPNAEALAITSIVLGGATGPPVVSSMSVTSVQGHTRDITAPNSQEHHGRPGIGIETIPGVETREPLTPNLPRESEAFTGYLPTPVNVDSLERVLVDHPDRLFVLRLCNSLRYGADNGYKGPRVPQFSRNLPTALDQPNVVTTSICPLLPPLGKLTLLPKNAFWISALFTTQLQARVYQLTKTPLSSMLPFWPGQSNTPP